MAEKATEVKKPLEIIYPKDNEITQENALFELAKAVREIRNWTRQVKFTEAGRIKATVWSAGGDTGKILRIMNAAAAHDNAKKHRQRLQQLDKKKALQEVIKTAKTP